MSQRSLVVRIVRGAFRGLDRLRRTLHFLLIVGAFLIVLAIMAPQAIYVPESAALVLNPQGAVVEQLSGDPLERTIMRAQGHGLDQSLLSDMIEAVRVARDDERIKALVLRPEAMTAAGLSSLDTLAAEIDMFRESGKPVFAIAAAYDRNQYFLAAHADEVLMHPMGIVFVEGYETYLPYFRSAIEKLEIDYEVWSAGEYKSAVEPIVRDDMSDEDREARLAYLNAMWRHYQDEVTAARDLDGAAMQRYADEFVELLEANGGDSAALALEYGLIDDLTPFDEMDTRIREIVGAGEDTFGFSAIDYTSYVSAVRAEDLSVGPRNRIAVIVASGEILDGEQPAGTIGAESLMRLIRTARDDENIRGLVLRVDSPGGSAFASELIRRELELFGSSGRPVVVSMGSVAASGGYWISMGADEIWAGETTLTGSIGAFATIPTFPRALARLGVSIDGVGTTVLSGQTSVLGGIGEDVSAYVGLSLRHTYEDFVAKVAAHRELDLAEAEASARGRVWIGTDALDRGLVDRLGDLDDAIESAAALAGLEDEDYAVEYLEAVPGFAERLALELVRIASPWIPGSSWSSSLPESVRVVLGEIEAHFPGAFRLEDPRGIYTHCLCDVR